MNEQPSMYIKHSLNSEIEKWLAEGNSITYVCSNKHQPSGFNNRIKATENKDKRDVKTRARRPEQQAVWSDVLKLKNWLEAKSGRMKALGEMVGLSPDYLSQIKNSKRKCSKERMARLLQASNEIELKELATKYCGEKE